MCSANSVRLRSGSIGAPGIGPNLSLRAENSLLFATARTEWKISDEAISWLAPEAARRKARDIIDEIPQRGYLGIVERW
jgi:hypothetical protein